MTLSLYQKYRPVRFADVVGQEHVTTTLTNALRANAVVRAYLFTGPRGLGKTTVARLLAKALNCTERAADAVEPCGTCPSCEALAQGTNLDVLEIDAASHTGVDTVRENIIATARLSPTRFRKKVYIIDEVHMLSTSAFNALLKTLEEPPEHVVFILATTEIHKVPATIVSRCQRFDFRKVQSEVAIGLLERLCKAEKKKVPISVLQGIVRQSEGCIRDAESLLGQVLILDEKAITEEQAALVVPQRRRTQAIELLQKIAAGEGAAALRQVGQFADEGVDLHFFARDVVDVVRDLLHVSAGALTDAEIAAREPVDAVALLELARHWTTSQLGSMLDIWLRASREVRGAEIPQLPVELAVVRTSELSGQSHPTPPPPPVRPTPTPSPKPIEAPQPTADPAPESTIAEPAEAAESGSAAAEKTSVSLSWTLEQIRAKWGDVVATIKERNHSLASTLRAHRPVAIREGDRLELQFTFRFHEQRVKEVKNRQVVEEVLQQVFGHPLRVETIMVEPKTVSDGPVEQANMQGMLQAFGGKMVD